jgi:hypothetical protein
VNIFQTMNYEAEKKVEPIGKCRERDSYNISR